MPCFHDRMDFLRAISDGMVLTGWGVGHKTPNKKR